jgi:hypothetical protein
MSQFRLLSTLATVAIASFAGPAVAQEATIPSQISTSVGFTLSGDGAVTSLTLSTALSDAYTFSSAASNNGGVYTEAFASNTNLELENSGMPSSINTGRAIRGGNTANFPSTISILAPGSVNVLVEESSFSGNDVIFLED